MKEYKRLTNNNLEEYDTEKNVWADIAIRIVKELTKQFGVEIKE